MWARPGMQCVCVDDAWSDAMCIAMGVLPPDRVPMIREILTIDEVIPFAEKVFISFTELGDGYGYAASSFRPLITKSDDIAMFAHHLDQVPA